jgi:SAM-dependent methyltransferase
LTANRWRQRVRRLTRPAWFGTLRRTSPLSSNWGYDRGTPVDRYYIERFLAENRQDIRGRVVEIKNSEYTQRFGMDVVQRDVLDVDPMNPCATIVADLSAADGVPDNLFDCVVLTQTLHFIPDLRAAVANVHRVLKPGGVVLATMPSVAPIEPHGGLDRDYWRFTLASSRWLFEQAFQRGQVDVRSYGNILADIGFLVGIAREELSPGELAFNDPYFPLIIAVRAVKVKT